ncbi:LysR family transcriptional regulator [Synoicihabitans lomoniglobus]|uniref:LysR substrate-binding domain-containing protein n=1 Tax=Synoicihabitans lomoniglobus TaxID=2909285 RepID=A0AAF0CPI1_9BACT|nr:LysR substrate-binding domain-containing protein [Opitutaceae bacterium LMO-M01]WED64864.1 LysR substrate-binding domain-containing protein [Opitutaceae bacterium LMO-M01]
MELRYLRSFVTVAETLHFGQAAERLKIAQPALSQHIQKLETSLEARLLDRNRHGVALTAVGQVFLREARSILAQVQHARNEVERVKAGGEGTLRLGYVPGPARGALTCALHVMRQKSPAVRVELHEAQTTHILRALLAGEYDAVLAPEFDPPFPRGLDHAEVASQRVLLVMGARHPMAAHDTVPLAELKTADWVSYADTIAPGYRRWINEVCRSAGFRPRIAQQVTASNDLQVAVATLPGVAIVPEGYRELFTDGVVFRPLEPEPDRMGLWLWCRKGDEGSALTAFRAALHETHGRGLKSGDA